MEASSLPPSPGQGEGAQGQWWSHWFRHQCDLESITKLSLGLGFIAILGF